MVAVDLNGYLASEFRSFGELPFGPADSAALAEFAMANSQVVAPMLPAKCFEGARVQADGLLAAGAVGDGDGAGRTRGGLRSLVGRMGRAGSQARRGTEVPAVGFRDLMRAECFDAMFAGGLQPERLAELVFALAASPRFRGMRLQDACESFDEGRQNQFFAITAVQPGSFAYVAFRGTDTSLTGWRENFNMVYDFPVPAQRQALAYLLAVARRVEGPLVLGGHSKGGNLALYAALMAPDDVRARIERIYAHDSPGFRPGAVPEGRWDDLRDRICRMAPQESTVGLLMDTPVPLRVVRSNGSGIMQHSMHTWEIAEGTADFAKADGLADSAIASASALAVWLDQYSDDEARDIVEALFAAIGASGAHGSAELLSGGMRTIGYVAQAARSLDVPHRDTLLAALAKLAEIGARGVVGDWAVSLGLRGRDGGFDPDALKPLSEREQDQPFAGQDGLPG